MRLIDADALVDEYIKLKYSDQTMGIVCNRYASEIARVGRQPTIDAVSVVRCQDCLHYKEKDLFGRIAHECEEYETDTGADGYCHKGIRREKGE